MSTIDFAFTRGPQTLYLTSEPLKLRYSSVTGCFQAVVADESVAENTDDPRFLYFGPLRYCLRTVEGPVVGFQLLDLETFEPEAFADATFGPKFDVPELGLQQADVGDIVHAAQRAFLHESEASG